MNSLSAINEATDVEEETESLGLGSSFPSPKIRSNEILSPKQSQHQSTSIQYSTGNTDEHSDKNHGGGEMGMVCTPLIPVCGRQRQGISVSSGPHNEFQDTHTHALRTCQ